MKMMMMMLVMTMMMVYGNDDGDDDHVAVGAPWVHPVSVHELDRRLAHRLYWTIHLVDVMIMMMIIMMIMMMMMMIIMMMVMMVMISTSCTAWSNCFLVITTFLGGILSGSIALSFWADNVMTEMELRQILTKVDVLYTIMA